MGQSNDGCDAIAVFVDTQNEQLIWSNARMHAFMLGADDEEVVNLDGDRKGIGYSDTATDYQWRRHQRPLRRGDQLLIVTDGVTDQIGGPREIMFGKKRIQSLLLQQRALPMSSISEALLWR
jgi:serine phosphatase RsbU (regulator of sigma subunit)